MVGQSPTRTFTMYQKLIVMNKISELKAVIGKDTSQNQSPTCRGKLIKVGKAYSTFESVPSPYAKFTKTEDVGVKYKVPNQFAWNSFFY